MFNSEMWFVSFQSPRSILIEKCVILFARVARNYLVDIINHADNVQRNIAYLQTVCLLGLIVLKIHPLKLETVQIEFAKNPTFKKYLSAA